MGAFLALPIRINDQSITEPSHGHKRFTLVQIQTVRVSVTAPHPSFPIIQNAQLL